MHMHGRRSRSPLEDAYEAFGLLGLEVLWDELGPTGASYFTPVVPLGRGASGLRHVYAPGRETRQMRMADGSVRVIQGSIERTIVRLAAIPISADETVALEIVLTAAHENSEWVFANLDLPPNFIEETALRGTPRYCRTLTDRQEPLDLNSWLPE